MMVALLEMRLLYLLPVLLFSPFEGAQISIADIDKSGRTTSFKPP